MLAAEELGYRDPTASKSKRQFLSMLILAFFFNANDIQNLTHSCLGSECSRKKCLLHGKYSKFYAYPLWLKMCLHLLSESGHGQSLAVVCNLSYSRAV